MNTSSADETARLIHEFGYWLGGVLFWVALIGLVIFLVVRALKRKTPTHAMTWSHPGAWVQAPWKFNPPPGWPPLPPGFVPPPGWQPNPSWPAAPPGWRWWIHPTQ